MKIGVVVFPGSNCDEDMVFAWSNIMKQEVVKLWHKQTDLEGCDLIVLPGGFSYGDYLRSGAIARFSPIMTEVIKHANNGGYVLGVCNGFQVLVESGLLPGALIRNTGQLFSCKNVYIKADNNINAPTASLDIQKTYKIPIAHGEGRYYASETVLADLEKNNQILFRYCDASGNVSEESNPNGSLLNIAGVSNAERNVWGMMPHPERAVDVELGNEDGKFIFESILKYLAVEV